MSESNALSTLRTKIVAWAIKQMLTTPSTTPIDWQGLINILDESERETTPFVSLTRQTETDRADLSTGVLLFSAGK